MSGRTKRTGGGGGEEQPVQGEAPAALDINGFAAALANNMRTVMENIQQAQENALTRLSTDLAAQNTNLIAAINAMNPQGARAAPPAVAPVQVTFARNPGAVDQNELLDYKKKEHLKLYSNAIKPLYSSTEELFDMQTKRFATFMQRMKQRAIQVGFLRQGDDGGSLMMIPNSIEVHNQQAPFVNILESYAEIDTAKIKAYENELKQANSRQAQNLDMLYRLIWASMDEQAQQIVGHWESRYKDETDVSFQRGLSLLATIIDLKTISSVATIEHERGRIISLAKFAASSDGDIPKIHEEVNDAMKNLAAYGSTYPNDDLLLILWEAYEQITCKAFREWLDKRKDAHDEKATVQTAQSLMQIVQNKYATLVKRKVWMTETTQDVQLLMAQQAQMKQNVQTLEAQLKAAKKKLAPGKKGKDGAQANPPTTQKRLSNEERYVYVKDRKPPTWLKNNTYSGSGERRWWNGSRYLWSRESNKWNKEKDMKLPNWWLKQSAKKEESDKSTNKKRKDQHQLDGDPKKRARVPVSAFEAIRQSRATEESDSE